MPSWGDAIGWIFDRLPTRKEGLLNEIKRINRRREDIQNKWLSSSPIASDVTEYTRLGSRLSELEERLKTFKA